MNFSDLIDRYFSNHPDPNFDDTFRKKAHVMGNRNAVYNFEWLPQGSVRIYFRSRNEFRNKPMIENGKIVGHYRMASPYKVIEHKGSFICIGTKKIVVKTPVQKWRTNDIKIKKSFFSKSIVLHVNNNHLNLKIYFDKMFPESLDIQNIDLD